MERLEDLLIDNLKIYQDDELYSFTSDSTLLTRFAVVKKNDVVADLCSGSGIVGLHLYALNRNLKSVTQFEMQKKMCELNEKSISYNNLQNVFSVVNTRVQDIDAKYNNSFSLIVCNPPYMKADTGEKEEKECIAMSKREVYLPLDELMFSVQRLLKFGGRVNLVYRADRLCDLIYTMKKFKIEPKKILPVSAKNKQPYLVLIEGVKGGRSGVKLLSPIINQSTTI